MALLLGRGVNLTVSRATLNTLQTNEAEHGAEKIERREKRNIEHDTRYGIR